MHACFPAPVLRELVQMALGWPGFGSWLPQAFALSTVGLLECSGFFSFAGVSFQVPFVLVGGCAS